MTNNEIYLNILEFDEIKNNDDSIEFVDEALNIFKPKELTLIFTVYGLPVYIPNDNNIDEYENKDLSFKQYKKLLMGSTPEHNIVKKGCETILNEYLYRKSKKNELSIKIKNYIVVFTDTTSDDFTIVLYEDGKKYKSIKVSRF